METSGEAPGSRGLKLTSTSVTGAPVSIVLTTLSMRRSHTLWRGGNGERGLFSRKPEDYRGACL